METLGKRFGEAAQRGLYSAAVRGVNIIITQIIPSKTPEPFDRGFYKSGWRPLKIDGGAAIENVQPHAAFIEGGVRAANVKPGAAMIAALAEWAVRKKLATPEEAKARAWAIAMSVKKRGIFQGGTGFRILQDFERNYLAKVVREEVIREVSKG